MTDSAVVIHTQQSMFPCLVEPVRRVTAFYQRDKETGSNEWYTPGVFIEAARDVLGTIDLDPASCETANRVVQAKKIYTVDDDGLGHEWCGRLWVNPPYDDAGSWIDKLDYEYQTGRVIEAILTVFANTSTRYFQPLWEYPMCFPIGRIKFISPDPGKNNSATKDSVFVYFGQNVQRFREVFSQFGPVGVLR